MLPTHAQQGVLPKRSTRRHTPLIKWLPFLLAIPLIMWFFGPYSVRLLHPPRTAIVDIYLDHSDLVIPAHLPRPPYHPSPADTTPPSKWDERAGKVKDAFRHAYEGYMKHAFPADELTPVSAGRINNFVGWGVTVYDALDTMWLMGLDEHFYDAVGFIGTVDFFETNNYAPFFETVIRHLGGLLSAYGLSGEPILLSKADELGRGLLPVFNTTSGFPSQSINPKTGGVRPGWARAAIWSESMSCQMEYKYLAHLTGKREYFDKVEHLMEAMYKFNLTDGFPVMWSWETGLPQDDRFSVGALADSGYEYFLKQWILSSHSETKIRDLYIKSANMIIDKLLFLTPNRGMLYVTDTHSGVPTNILEHLSCFLSGMLALGVHQLKSDLTPREQDLHMWAAKGLAQTCVLMYQDQVSGLGPDEAYMVPYPKWEDGRWMKHVEQWEKEGKVGVPPGLREIQPERDDAKREYKPKGRNYVLRPETVESLYVLWKITGEEKYREWGWTIFEAIEKNSKTQSGYAGIVDVYADVGVQKDEMPSFFLAETLKYLYLLFNDAEIISLDNFVFNTEAHPLPVFEWTMAERNAYHIE